MFAECMFVCQSAVHIEIIVIVTWRSGGIGQCFVRSHALVCIFRRVVDISHIVIVVDIDIGLLHLLECFVRVETERHLGFQSGNKGIQVSGSRYGCIEVTAAVLFHATSGDLCGTVFTVAAGRHKEFTVRAEYGIHRKVFAGSPGKEVPYVNARLGDIVDTSAQVHRYIQELVYIDVDVRTQVVAVQYFLCAVAFVPFCPFGVEQTFLAEIREGDIVTCTCVTAADRQVGTVLRSCIPQHGVVPVRIEVFVFCHSFQLLTVADTTVVFQVFIGIFGT